MTNTEAVAKFNSMIQGAARVAGEALTQLRAVEGGSLVWIYAGKCVLAKAPSLQEALFAARATVRKYGGNVPGLSPEFTLALKRSGGAL